MATKYHLLGLGPKAYAYNFALGSEWTPNPSILVIDPTSLEREEVINF